MSYFSAVNDLVPGMASARSPWSRRTLWARACARAFWPGLLCLPWFTACDGTQQAVFARVLAPSVSVAGQSGSGAAGSSPGSALDAGVPTPPPPPADAGQAPDDAGGSALPDPGLDPNVVFDWTETLPGAGTCSAGRYVGSFSCTAPGVAGLPVTVSGELTVLLGGTTEEQKLSVQEGTVKGAFFLAPMISGELDCPTLAFSATSVDGMDLFTAERFESSFEGTLNVDTLVIEGTFELTNASAMMCMGTFRLGIAP